MVRDGVVPYVLGCCVFVGVGAFRAECVLVTLCCLNLQASLVSGVLTQRT